MALSVAAAAPPKGQSKESSGETAVNMWPCWQHAAQNIAAKSQDFLTATSPCSVQIHEFSP
jgi:hypothetical protein